MRLLGTLPGMFLLAASAVLAQNNPVEILGTWYMTPSVDAAGQPQGESEKPRKAMLSVDLVGGMLTGMWTSGRYAYPVQDLVYADGLISFFFEFDSGDAEKHRVAYKGLVVGDRMMGKLASPRGSKRVNGERAVQEQAETPPPAP